MVFIGTDIVDLDQFQKVMERGGDAFIQKLFTTEEIAYCSVRRNALAHYAGRFAGKEAVKKALLSYDPELLIPLKSIDIQRRDDGAPTVNVDEKIQFDGRLQLSISHAGLVATATAILDIS